MPLPNISEAGVMAIQQEKACYNPPSGVSQLREAIAKDASKRRGIRILPDQVGVGPRAQPGLFFPTMVLVEEEYE